MTRSIREILPQRSDFSPLLAHLTSGEGEGENRRKKARRNLLSILSSGVVVAQPHGLLSYRSFRVPDEYLRVVCLTDTPPEQLATILGKISKRKARLDNFGLLFSKRFIMRRGGNPVIYLCTQTGNDLVDTFASLIRAGLRSGRSLDDLAPLLPFIESFGPGYFNPELPVDFHYEREWRVPGNLTFRRRDVLLGLCDDRDVEHMERVFRPIKFIDPLVNPVLWGDKVHQARDRAWGEYLEPFPE